MTSMPPESGSPQQPAYAPPPQQFGATAYREQFSAGPGLAITAFVLAIFAIVSTLIPFVNWLGTVAGIAAIALGIVARSRNHAGRGFAIAALYIGAIGFITSLTFAVIYTLIGGVLSES